jgi:predicted transcriptional regulator of viral defense system
MWTFYLEAEMQKQAIEIFRKHGGQLRMSDAVKMGITRYMLYSMRDKGIIERVSRGIYRLVDMPALSNPDLVTVGLRFPKTVVCLISALSFHNITTQIPHEVSVAIPRDSRVPSLEYPPLRVYTFAEAAYKSGIEVHVIDDVAVKIYSPEKTLADCFKFRNKLGMEVVLEGLRLYKSRKRFQVDELLRFAKICRVEKVMMPYLEATL